MPPICVIKVDQHSIVVSKWPALAECLGVPHHTLLQVSTSGALVEGVYERTWNEADLTGSPVAVCGTAGPGVVHLFIFEADPLLLHGQCRG